MGTKLITPPDTEPITLTEAKAHLRVIHNDEDNLIKTEISAAREYCEGFQNRAYYTQTWKLIKDAYIIDEIIDIPYPPLQSLDSFVIIDVDDTEYDVTEYTLDDASEHARLIIDDYPSMDADLRDIAGVQITFTAGHTSTDKISEKAKQAIKLLIGHMHENRQAVITGDVPRKLLMSVKSLLWQNRVVPV